MINDREHFSAY